jgi:PAS domain S-box-containing protein
MNAVSSKPRQRRFASESKVAAAKTRTRGRPGEAAQGEPIPRIAVFFQEPGFFRALKKTILPRILKAKLPGEPIRVWVPGAATGEEVYSIAICLLEALGDQSASTPIRLFGTDLVEEAIQKARAATYPEKALFSVSQERLRRFFVKEAGKYRVSRIVREACIFACHNITHDPPFSRLDLIRSRNVLACLEPMLQKQVLATFHYALRDTGFLLLGELETPGACHDLFKMVDQNNRFFVKRTDVQRTAHGAFALWRGHAFGPPARYGVLSGEPDFLKKEQATLRAQYAEAAKESEVLRLTNELIDARESLRATIQQYETMNEELKSANEEALSSMEELASINNELKTAKHELQTVNEQLIAFSGQAQKRNVQLAELNDDLTNILAGVNIPIVVLGSDHRIRRATATAEKLLHVLPADAGRPIGDIRMGLAIAGVEELISTVLKERRELEQEVRGEDGRWYSLRLRPCWTGAGKVGGVLLALLDIHALKQSQEAARKQERFVSAILDAAGWTLLVLVLDPEGRIVHFNRACQVLTGYSLEEVRGKRPWDFLLSPQELGGFKAVFEHLTSMSTQEHQGHCVTKDGRSRLIAWTINVTADEDGRVQYMIGSGIDVTERQQAREQARQSEATVRALLETAAQAILGINAAGEVVLANAAAEAVFGYRREEMLDQPVERLVPPRLRPQHLHGLSVFMQGPHQRPMRRRLDAAGIRKDGTEFPVELSLSHVATGEEGLSVAFITDITERKRTEEVLRRSESQARVSQRQLRLLTARLLEAQEEERRRLSRELHDDLNQKLAMLAVELGGVEARLPQSESTIREQLLSVEKRLKGLSDDVRRTAYRLHPSVLEHLGLVDALETHCVEFSAQEGINIDFRRRRVPAPIPKGVALCLYRVAQEALRNIVRHSGAARASVTLAGMSGAITLSVEDQGRGFDPSMVEGKRGLGLTSMKERAIAAGGLLTIDARPGAGTRVQVQIPLAGGSK